MKTLKQHLADNSIYLSDEILKRIQKAVNEYNKEWLTQKPTKTGQEIHDCIEGNWSTKIRNNFVNDKIIKYIPIEKLLEELNKNE
ncbi:MAG: hypothetical protein ABSF73_10210 [Terriglobia bacterium]|jgi:hypothetical protein